MEFLIDILKVLKYFIRILIVNRKNMQNKILNLWKM